jgi:hypothetical protein
MKRIKLILVCGLTLAVTGLTTLLVAAGANKDATAVVRSVTGSVQYKGPADADFKPLKVNQELVPGTALKSGPDSAAYLMVNGRTSTVKVTANTTMTLTTMLTVGADDSSTTLKLDGGTLLGSVKKLSGNSDYKVTVPNGVAAIRGTDWQVSVTYQANGNFTVTFTSVTGVIFCQVTPPPAGPGGPTPGGPPNSQTLTSGQSWTVTGTTTVGPGGVPVTTTVTITVPFGLTPLALAALVAQQLGLNYSVVTGNAPLAGGFAPPGWQPPPTSPGGLPGPPSGPPPGPPPGAPPGPPPFVPPNLNPSTEG